MHVGSQPKIGVKRSRESIIALTRDASAPVVEPATACMLFHRIARLACRWWRRRRRLLQDISLYGANVWLRRGGRQVFPLLLK